MFIKKTLVEICDGIAEARSDIETKYKGNCIIAPVIIIRGPYMTPEPGQ